MPAREEIVKKRCPSLLKDTVAVILMGTGDKHAEANHKIHPGAQQRGSGRNTHEGLIGNVKA
jgi:hypothetical protein